VEEAHEAVRSGKFAAPSRTVKMPLREAAARMVRNGDGEGGECFWFSDCLPILTLCFTGVYVQALITDELAREAGLTPSSSSSSNAEGEQTRSEGEGEPSEPWRSMDRAGWRETQPPRLWLSAAGSTSPLHFDSSASVLAQVTGTKRMLLYPPSALSRAHLYPDWHPLRRRSKVRLDADVDVDDARRAFPRWTGSRFAVEPSSDSSSDSSNDSEPFEETAGTPRVPARRVGGCPRSRGRPGVSPAVGALHRVARSQHVRQRHATIRNAEVSSYPQSPFQIPITTQIRY
jgi:hypothetical protein